MRAQEVRWVVCFAGIGQSRFHHWPHSGHEQGELTRRFAPPPAILTMVGRVCPQRAGGAGDAAKSVGLRVDDSPSSAQSHTRRNTRNGAVAGKVMGDEPPSSYHG